jgi:hypothetical protein
LNLLELVDVVVINFVNPEAKDTQFLVDRMKVFNSYQNKNWRFVDIKDINITAPRSNCVLSIEKLRTMFPDFYIATEAEAIGQALSNIK